MVIVGSDEPFGHGGLNALVRASGLTFWLSGRVTAAMKRSVMDVDKSPHWDRQSGALVKRPAALRPGLSKAGMQALLVQLSIGHPTLSGSIVMTQVNFAVRVATASRCAGSGSDLTPMTAQPFARSRRAGRPVPIIRFYAEDPPWPRNPIHLSRLPARLQ